MRRFEFFGSYNSFRPFKIKVRSSIDSTFTIPTLGGGYYYSLEVSDGQTFNGLTGNKTVTFAIANTDYILKISGLFPAWNQQNAGDGPRVLDIMQFGDVQFTGYSDFYGCQNMIISAVDQMQYKPLSLGRFLENCATHNYNFSYLDLSNNTVLFNAFYANYNLAGVLDFSDPVTGSINVTSISNAFAYTKLQSIKLQAGSMLGASDAFYLCYSLTELVLIDMRVSFNIAYTGLSGIGIDQLADSVANMTGFGSPTIIMSVAQKASCNITLWANKNWTIATV